MWLSGVRSDPAVTETYLSTGYRRCEGAWEKGPIAVILNQE